MITVAFICHGFPEGGITRINCSIAQRISRSSNDFRFIFIADEPAALPGDFPFEVVATRDYVSAVKEHGIDILVQCSRLEKQAKEIARAGARVVYADHGQAFGEQYAIVDRRMGGRRRRPLKRLIWHLFLNKTYLDHGKGLRLAIERTAKAYNLSDAYVCLCDAYAHQIKQALGLGNDNRLWVIENFQERVDHPCLEKEKRILYCGRLSDYDKKVDRLLRIWHLVQDQLPDYSLDIVGDGYERGRLEKYASALGLRRVTFHGNVADPDAFYRRSSILCLVSKTEGWGLVLTEAQAHGVIPIAFDCSAGVNEVLRDGAGVLVPPGDEQQFAKELIDLCRRDDLSQMRLRCIEKSGEYSPERNSAKWEKLFRSLSSEQV